MQRFYSFLSNRREQVVLGVAIFISLVLMLFDPATQLRVANRVAFGLTALGHRVFAWPIELASLRYENEVLRDQNARLSLELHKLREARLENVRLYELLHF